MNLVKMRSNCSQSSGVDVENNLCVHINISSVVEISKMVGPKKQAFCSRINMVKGNFDTVNFRFKEVFGNSKNLP